MDFSTQNEPVWFYFDESNHELGSIALRKISPEAARRIRKETTKTERVFKEGRFVETIIVDEDKDFELTWDYCIVDWEVVVVDGEKLECTSENKLRAMNSLGFVRFINECLGRLTKQTDLVDEARVKNLKNTSDGREKSRHAKNASDSGAKNEKSLPAADAM